MNDTLYTTNNHTKEDGGQCERKCVIHTLDFILVSGYCILFLIGSTGNTLVIIVFHKNLKKGPIIDLLIYLLAVCDLACSCISPWLLIYWILTCNCRWHFGIVACKFIPTLSRVLTDISIGTMLIMAIDRCRAIVTPMKARFSRPFIVKCFLLTVLLSMLCQLYYVISLHTFKGGCQVKRVEEPSFHVPLVTVVTIRTLAFILIFSVTTVAVQIALQKNMGNTLLRSFQKQKISRRAQVMKMLVVMAITFIITVIPRDMLHLVYTISYIPPGDGIPYSNAMLLTNEALKLLQTSNCIYNVFIYGKMHNKFLYKAKRIITCQGKPSVSNIPLTSGHSKTTWRRHGDEKD